jgi:excisionase family DNA binding protein
MAEERLTLTVEQAAEKAGISRSLAYNLARQGRLPGALRLGHRLIVSRRTFEHYLNGDGAGLAPPPVPSLSIEGEE